MGRAESEAESQEDAPFRELCLHISSKRQIIVYNHHQIYIAPIFMIATMYIMSSRASKSEFK